MFRLRRRLVILWTAFVTALSILVVLVVLQEQQLIVNSESHRYDLTLEEKYKVVRLVWQVGLVADRIDWEALSSSSSSASSVVQEEKRPFRFLRTLQHGVNDDVVPPTVTDDSVTRQLQDDAAPSLAPSSVPSWFPSMLPSQQLRQQPFTTPSSSQSPSQTPSLKMSAGPSETPSLGSTQPSAQEETSTQPSGLAASLQPSQLPSTSISGSAAPSQRSFQPSSSLQPTSLVSVSTVPSVVPSRYPSTTPSGTDQELSSSIPSSNPTDPQLESSNPSVNPTEPQFAQLPSTIPSVDPTDPGLASSIPSFNPTEPRLSSSMPSFSPTNVVEPSRSSLAPSGMPSANAFSDAPSIKLSPSMQPSTIPSLQATSGVAMSMMPSTTPSMGATTLAPIAAPIFVPTPPSRFLDDDRIGVDDDLVALPQPSSSPTTRVTTEAPSKSTDPLPTVQPSSSATELSNQPSVTPSTSPTVASSVAPTQGMAPVAAPMPTTDDVLGVDDDLVLPFDDPTISPSRPPSATPSTMVPATLSPVSATNVPTTSLPTAAPVTADPTLSPLRSTPQPTTAAPVPTEAPQTARPSSDRPAVLIRRYDYGRGNCPNAGSRGVPCAPADLASRCNKYDRVNGRMSRCLLACAPSFCCIHDAPAATNQFAPSCNTDENCRQYNPCNIVWWKLHDLVGPASEFNNNLQQSDDFFDIEMVQDVLTDSQFFEQLLFHHFDDIGPFIDSIREAGSITAFFSMQSVWNASSVLP